MTTLASPNPPITAKVYGIPYNHTPKDLYIPPDALEIFLDAFEGPLDLLLYLIRKANINILDIPMAELTTQYVHYVEQLRTQRLELGAEYLLMAAYLLDIKAKMLLPKPVLLEDDEEEKDPRVELALRLLTYEKMRNAAMLLNTLPQVGRDFEWAQVDIPSAPTTLPKITTKDILAAWITVMQRGKLTTHHKVKRIILSVREHMSLLLRRLTGQKEPFFHFIATPTKPHLIVMFLALLELMKEGLVDVWQNGNDAPPLISLTEGSTLPEESI